LFLILNAREKIKKIYKKFPKTPLFDTPLGIISARNVYAGRFSPRY